MNDSKLPDDLSVPPWPTHRPRVPDASTLPETGNAGAAAVELLNQAAQGAHETIDRVVESAAPAVRQLGDRVSAAEVAVQAKAGQWRETGETWVAGARSTVRASPLASVAAALAVGALIARITR